MPNWIGSCYDIMDATFIQNEGEFTGQETEEVANISNIKLLLTAAESLFQNGFCKCNHIVPDMFLELQGNYQKSSLNV